MKAVHVLIAVLLIALFTPFVFADEAGDKQQAQAAGQQWLGVIDSGNYLISYDQASTMIKNAVTREDWVKAMNAARMPLGNVVSRQLGTATYTTSLPGAPDGKYVVMQFNTSFEHKKTAIETVTMIPSGDGQWKAAGYYIK